MADDTRGPADFVEIASTFDTLAGTWDTRSASVARDPRSNWARKVPLVATPGERILDLGCGTGVPVGRLLSRRYEYIGVDVSSKMLELARTIMPSSRLVHASMTAVQFAPESFGAVVAFSSIPHVPRDLHAALFATIATWLRFRGVFVGSLLSDDEPAGYQRHWRGAGPMRWSGFDAATNLQLLSDAGFDIVDSVVAPRRAAEAAGTARLWFAAQRVG